MTTLAAVEPFPIRSDSLRPLRELCAAYPWLAEIVTVFQMRLVIDANIILGDLRWLITKRTSPDAQTTLQEVIAAGTVVAYAPRFLDEEILTHLPRLAEEASVPLEQYETAWAQYRAGLHFFEPVDDLNPEAAEKVRDPKDLPYVQLYSQIGAVAVYSRDKDIEAMGAPVVTEDNLRALRAYSRAAPVSLTISVGGSLLLVASAAATYTAFGYAVGLVKQVGHLPRGVKIALAVLALVALLHPPSRAWLKQALTSLPSHLRPTFQVILPLLGEAVDKAVLTHEHTRSTLQRVRGGLPRSPHYRLRTHILAVCVAAGRPLMLAEIVHALRAAGCRAKSRNLSRYLARALQEDARFALDETGHWSIAAG